MFLFVILCFFGIFLKFHNFILIFPISHDYKYQRHNQQISIPSDLNLPNILDPINGLNKINLKHKQPKRNQKDNRGQCRIILKPFPIVFHPNNNFIPNQINKYKHDPECSLNNNITCLSC